MSSKKQRRKFSSEFKTKLALVTLKGESTLTEMQLTLNN